MIEVKGYWFDGISSDSSPAILSIHEDGIIKIQADEIRLTVNLERLSISSRLGNTPRRVRIENGGLFETDYNDAIDLLAANKSPWFNLIHRIESNLFLCFGGVLVIGMISWWFLTDGLPRTSNFIAHQLPVSITESIGKQFLSIIEYASFEETSLTIGRQKEVRRLFTDIVQNSDMSGKHCRLEFYSAINSFGPNAFALPPCLIIATDEFIQIAESEDEISAVFAHEIGHIHYRHTLRRIVQNSFVSFAILLMSGDATQIPADLLSISTVFMELSYSRNFEKEADSFAYVYMNKHGIALHSFPDILRSMETWQFPKDEETAASHECSIDPVAPVDNLEDPEQEEVPCGNNGTQVTESHEKWQDNWPRYFSSHPDTEERALLFIE